MEFFFITLILRLINTCILRKPIHCNAHNLIKNRIVPIFKDEATNKTKEPQILKRPLNDKSKDTAIEPENKLLKTNNLHEHSLNKTFEENSINDGDVDKFPDMDTDNILSEIYNIYNISRENEREEFRKKYKRLLLGDIEGFYELLKFYLKKNISEKQQMYYKSRIENINDVYKDLHLKKQRSLKVSEKFKEHDSQIINLLEVMISDDWLGKQPLDYDSCINSYQDIIKEKKLSSILNYLYRRKKDTLKLYFYYQISKAIEYSHLIPWLMMFGGFCSEFSYANLTFNIHLIRTLIKNFSNNKNTEKLCFFIFYISIKQTKKRALDIFSVNKLKTVCLNKLDEVHKKNFFYLAWELESSNRQNLKEILSEQGHLPVSHYSNNKHLILITLIYLYQQIVFLKFKNGNNFEIDRKYINLFDNFFTESNNCFACGFEEFMKILREEQI